MTTLTLTKNTTTLSPVITDLFLSDSLKGLIENTRNNYSLKNNGTLSTDLISYDDLFQELFFYMNNYNPEFGIQPTLDKLISKVDKLTTSLEEIEELTEQMAVVEKINKVQGKIDFLSQYTVSDMEIGLGYGILKSCLYTVIGKMTYDYKVEIGIDTDFSNIINSSLRYKASNGVDGTMNVNNNERLIQANKEFYNELCKALELNNISKDILRYNRLNTYKPSEEDIKKGIKDYYYLTLQQLSDYRGYAMGSIWRYSGKLNDSIKTYLTKKHF